MDPDSSQRKRRLEDSDGMDFRPTQRVNEGHLPPSLDRPQEWPSSSSREKSASYHSHSHSHHRKKSHRSSSRHHHHHHKSSRHAREDESPFYHTASTSDQHPSRSHQPTGSGQRAYSRSLSRSRSRSYSRSRSPLPVRRSRSIHPTTIPSSMGGGTGMSALERHLAEMEAERAKRYEEERLAQKALEESGIEFWKEWCHKENFVDDDLVTPQKLKEYVDLVVMPRERDQARQRSRYHDMVPLTGLEAFVMPVISLWKVQNRKNRHGGASGSIGHNVHGSGHLGGLTLADEYQLQELLEVSHSLAKISNVIVERKGLRTQEMAFVERLEKAQQEARDKGVTGFLVSPLLVSLFEQKTGYMSIMASRALGEPPQDTAAPASAPSSAIAPSPSSRAQTQPPVQQYISSSLDHRHTRVPPSFASRNDIKRAPSTPTTARTTFTPATFTPPTPTPRARPKAASIAVAGEEPPAGMTFKAADLILPIKGVRSGVPFRGDAPRYSLNKNVVAIWQVLQEWMYGIDGKMSIQELNQKYGTQWRDPSDQFQYSAATCIVKEYRRLVLEVGHTEEEALKILSNKLRKRALTTLATEIFKDNTNRSRSQDTLTVAGYGAVPGASSPSSLSTYTTVPSTPTNGASNSRIDGRARVSNEELINKDFVFPIRPEIETVHDLWAEWNDGWKGQPSIIELGRINGPTWRKSNSPEHKLVYQVYYYKYKIISEVERMMKEDGYSLKDSLDLLDNVRGNSKMSTLATKLSQGQFILPSRPGQVKDKATADTTQSSIIKISFPNAPSKATASVVPTAGLSPAESLIAAHIAGTLPEEDPSLTSDMDIVPEVPRSTLAALSEVAAMETFNSSGRSTPSGTGSASWKSMADAFDSDDSQGRESFRRPAAEAQEKEDTLMDDDGTHEVDRVLESGIIPPSLTANHSPTAEEVSTTTNQESSHLQSVKQEPVVSHPSPSPSAGSSTNDTHAHSAASAHKKDFFEGQHTGARDGATSSPSATTAPHGRPYHMSQDRSDMDRERHRSHSDIGDYHDRREGSGGGSSRDSSAGTRGLSQHHPPHHPGQNHQQKPQHMVMDPRDPRRVRDRDRRVSSGPPRPFRLHHNPSHSSRSPSSAPPPPPPSPPPRRP